jgi:acyl-coenzyme A thioesterase PaaI-like protein
MSSLLQHIKAQLINFYPPFIGSGIRAHNLDQYTIRVEMKLTVFNRNIFGTHFGGSLYSMCDPWFVLILMRNLGKDYIVWDKAANIKFVQPGRGTVTATFHIPRDRIDEICLSADGGQKIEPQFLVNVLNKQGQVVAVVEKFLYVRKSC